MTDLIQSIIMTIALFIVVIFGIHTVGGFDAVIANAKSMNGYLSLFLPMTLQPAHPFHTKVLPLHQHLHGDSDILACRISCFVLWESRMRTN